MRFIEPFKMRSKQLQFLIFFGVAVAVSAILFVQLHCTTPTKISQSDSFFLNLNDSVHYVGMNECKKCHPDKHETFVHTGMGLSFDSATEQKSSGQFSHIKPVYDKKRNLFYFPFWRNHTLYISEYRLNGKDTEYYREEKIDFIIGSGQHTNSHFWRDGNFVYQAPLTYYTQEKKWDLPPGYEANNTSFHRKIDIECMACHNGLPSLKTGSVNLFEKIPRGIDCERCHGPGELHVKQKMAGQIIDTRKMADRSIVNPKRLPYTLQVDICQRCHLQGNNVLKPGKTFADFRPGMKLSQIFEVYMPKYQGGQKFVMAGHAEQFQKSQCFIKSNKGNVEQYNPNINFTCINCHNPHISVKQTNITQFNNQCINCHHEKSTKSAFQGCLLSKEKQIHPKGCVGCHMPSSGAEDIPHVQVHDHRIQRPSKSSISLKGKLIGLYAVNQKNPDSETLLKAYLTYFEKFESNPLYLQKAEIIANKSENIEQKIHLAFLKNDYASVIQWSEKLVDEQLSDWTNYRVAKAFDKTGNLPEAILWYKKAHDLMPFHLDFGAEYANAVLRQAMQNPKYKSQLEPVKELLKQQLSMAKKHELTWLNWGHLSFLEGNLNDAKTMYLKAISLNPDLAIAQFSLAVLYYSIGDTNLAKLHVEKCLKITPNDKEALKLKLQLNP